VPHSFTEIAWSIRALVRSPQGRDRFRDQIRTYLNRRGNVQHRLTPKDLLWHDEEMMLDEKYALLSALHDEVCTGEAKLGPRIKNVPPGSNEELFDGVRWITLRDVVREWLENDSVQNYSRHAQSWLAEIETDLRSTIATGPTSPVPIPAGHPVAPSTLEEEHSNAEGLHKLKQLEPAVRRAYFAYLYAENKAERRLTDREAYDWLKENGISDKDPVGELADYELPSFLAFTRNCSEARSEVGENKHLPRRGRSTGKSVVKKDQV
jgi:hypothetical protein